MPRDRKRWPIRRWRELDDLRRLLIEVSSLNSGNCVIQRMRECIRLAKKLDRHSRDLRRPGFLRWLIDLAESGEPPRKESTDAP